MSYSPGTIIVGKYNQNGDFAEDTLDCTDINAVAITGTQTISGEKTFANSVIIQGDLNVSGSVSISGSSSTTTGIILISDVSNVSGTMSEFFYNLEVLTLPSGITSSFRFPFCIPIQPIEPINLQIFTIPRVSGQSGTLKLNINYNIFEQNTSVATNIFGATEEASQNILSSDYEKIKLITIPIQAEEFTASGSYPFFINCKIARDISVSGNYPGAVSIANIFINYTK